MNTRLTRPARAILTLAILPFHAAHAGIGMGTISAHWRASPTSSNFFEQSNWTENMVPDSIAFFSESSITSIEFGTGVTHGMGSLALRPTAPAYTFDVFGGTTLALLEGGIINQTAHTPIMNIVNAQVLIQGAAAGVADTAFNVGPDATITFEDGVNTNAASFVLEGSDDGFASVLYSSGSTPGAASIVMHGSSWLEFSDACTAGTATITNHDGEIIFRQEASAQNATITNDGVLFFFDFSQGGNSTIINSGLILLFDNMSLGNATIYNQDGGSIDIAAASIFTNPQGQDARLITEYNSYLYLEQLTLDSFSLGSLSGEGSVRLASKQLAVGNLGLDGDFTGDIDGTGDVIKYGTGNMTLGGTNDYTGATNVEEGGLYINGSIASAANRAFDGGTIGGNGTIGGSLSVRSGGTIAPGAGPNQVGSLEITAASEFRGGSSMIVDVSQASLNSITGAGTGWDVITLGSTLNFTSTPGVTIRLRSIDPNTGEPGLASGFNPGQPHSWLVIDGSSSVASNQFPNYSPALFTFDLTGFANAHQGTFEVVRNDRRLFIAYTPDAPPACLGDADQSGSVDFADITFVLSNWGADYSPGTGLGDANQDGMVNFADITAALSNFGLPCD